jgi:hypothetical protein
MSNYTPGPWKIVTSERGRIYIRTESLEFIADCTIRNAPVRGDPSPHWADEAMANAALIAAAPEMLTELKSLVSLIAAEYPKQQAVWLEGARAAIAKAESSE